MTPNTLASFIVDLREQGPSADCANCLLAAKKALTFNLGEEAADELIDSVTG